MYHWTSGRKKPQFDVFLPLLWTLSKWISLLLQMFSLVLFGGTRLATSAVSDTWWPLSRSVSQWVSKSGVEEVECPPSASPSCSSGWSSVYPRSTSKHLLQLEKSWLPATDGPPLLHPAAVLPPSLSSFDTKITLAGRCNCRISGIFASVLLF